MLHLFLCLFACVFIQNEETIREDGLSVPDIRIFSLVVGLGSYGRNELFSEEEMVLVREFVGASRTHNSMFEESELTTKEERRDFLMAKSVELVDRLREDHPRLYSKIVRLYLIEDVRYKIRERNSCLPAFLYYDEEVKAKLKLSVSQEQVIKKLAERLEEYELEQIERANRIAKKEIEDRFYSCYAQLEKRDREWFDLVVGSPVCLSDGIDVVDIVGPKRRLAITYEIPKDFVKYLNKLSYLPEEDLAYREDDCDTSVLQLLCNDAVMQFIELEEADRARLNSLLDSGEFRFCNGDSEFNPSRKRFLVRGMANLPVEIVNVIGEDSARKFLQIEFQVRTGEVFSFGVLSEACLQESQLSDKGVAAFTEMKSECLKVATEVSQELKQRLIRKLKVADSEAYGLLNAKQRKLIDKSYVKDDLVEVFMGEIDLIELLKKEEEEQAERAG